ncbi:PAS domain-containing sensor histidine kinase [Deinococcus arenicola]|uniref:histidine kinase n=1 Tax=Deinococcus arenicola TaxID=2994950 RepID=A0ABU4DVS6_9DEIO|nr:ATP-binding protein [Deinococcus sp. ZS9-10]MDV6376554.1 ATP-binding protein [Deinococcus sp. ZS9-10]
MTLPLTPDPTLDVSELRAIIDSSADCIKVLDLEARVLSMNAGGMETMEIADFSVCHNLLWPSFWEGEACVQVEQALDAARAGQTTTFEGPARTFAGTPKWWEVRVSPLRAPDGIVTRLLASSRDITARKRIEQQLIEAQHELRNHAQALEVRVEQRERALEAFVHFTTQVASSTDLNDIATAASDIIRDAVGGAISGFYLVKGELAYPVMFSSNTPPAVIAARRAGIALSAPLVADALARRGTSFLTGEDGRVQSVGYASALSITAYHQGDQPYALFATGCQRTEWTAQEQAIIESVGRGLGLALERAAQTQELTRQRDALTIRTHELIAANEELDAFTYSASHDLRTPIRHVMGFADLARAALVKNQPEKIGRNLDIIQQGAMRMNGLIDGMLMLSRAGRQDFRPQMVPLEPLIVQAQQDAQLEFPEQVIDVRFQGAVIVWGDATLIQQVLTNLISNAVKYSTGREVSEVTVHVGDTEAEWTITVRDNGVGFNPEYSGKLFGIFQRLHTQDVFPGIGVGLATVRRIALKHGGRVFADGAVDQGATFGVALPKPVV